MEEESEDFLKNVINLNVTLVKNIRIIIRRRDGYDYWTKRSFIN